jgi:ketosteroid isomerase-like protein
MGYEMKRYILILASLLAFIATACVQQVDIDAEKAAIEKMLADWVEASNQGGEAGADGYASFVTEDAVYLPPNAVLVEGRAGVREAILGFTMAEDFSVTWSATSINVAADGKQAYGFGRFEYSLKDDAGNPVTEIGKWVDVFEKQADGSWLVSVVMFNSDLPTGGASE